MTEALEGNNITTTVAIINHRYNLSALGSIIGLTKKYVDVVYVLQDNNDKSISEMATLVGAKIINLSDNGHTAVLDTILRSEKDVRALVTLYGDGTHDPNNIPHLMDSIMKGEFHVVTGQAFDNNPKVNSNLMLLTKGNSTLKASKNNHSGFAAISGEYLETVKSSIKGSDILNQILSFSKNKTLKVKHLQFANYQILSILNKHNIGVVVPAYNEELLIEETIKGIPKYVDKIYLIDDCSTDNSWKIISSFKRRFPKKIKALRLKKNINMGGDAAGNEHGRRNAG